MKHDYKDVELYRSTGRLLPLSRLSFETAREKGADDVTSVFRVKEM